MEESKAKKTGGKREGQKYKSLLVWDILLKKTDKNHAMIRERVRSGMANAKAKGKQIGRPQTTKDSIPAIFLRHYPAYKSGQLNITELSSVCDLSRTTIYKYISLLEA